MLLAAVLLAVPLRVIALSSCAAFDVNWNLFLFGVDGKDYSAGDVTSWDSAGSNPTDITTSGRPPFSSSNVTCYLSQFFNAIYVLNADESNPSDIYIYDAASSSWSTQKVTTGSFDPTTSVAILDHDTNVFYALSNGEMYSLDMKSLVQAEGTALEWVDNKKAEFSTDGYRPTMAIAKNHVHFLGVPGTQPGSDNIFVIHFSYFQPETQSYDSDFPNSHGQASSFFLDEGVQKEYAFVPDDYSATYIVNVDSNTTKTFPAPTSDSKTTDFSLFGTPSSLIYLTSSSIAYLPYSSDTTSAEWKTLNSLNSVVSSSSSSATAASSGSGSATGASSTDEPSDDDEDGGVSLHAYAQFHVGLLAALVLGSFSVLAL